MINKFWNIGQEGGTGRLELTNVTNEEIFFLSQLLWDPEINKTSMVVLFCIIVNIQNKQYEIKNVCFLMFA